MATRYEIVLTPAAKRDLKALPRATVRRIDARLLSLRENPRPHGVKQLQGPEGFLRIRVGDYRVVYQVADKRLARISHNRHRKRPLPLA
jgi:mRNA interferase RelE/StbE